MRMLGRAVAALSISLPLFASAGERPALVAAAAPAVHTIDGGSWSATAMRTATPWACGDARAALQCAEHSVVIDNQSPQTLECFTAFATRSGDAPALSGPDIPAVVLPRTSHEIRGPIAVTSTTVETSRLECRARPPYQRLSVAAGCKYEMFGKPFAEFYPASAVTQALEGPVVVAFRLPTRNGLASEITVADSSLVASLDEAAKRFVKEQRFTTTCPGTRFDMRMRFKLQDRYGVPAR